LASGDLPFSVLLLHDDVKATMPHPGNKIHIPLSEREAVRLLGKVKPTAEMPRPGAQAKKPKKRSAKKQPGNSKP
jgi:hypothetical protein